MSDWTPARVERLTKLYRDGCSASQIAKILGHATRNAVIGKAHRLGLRDELQASRAAAGFTRNIAPRYTAPKVGAAPRTLQNRINAKQVSTKGNLLGPEGVAGMKARVQREARSRPPPVLIDAGKHATLMQLTSHMCRWPMSDLSPGHGDETLFCSAPKAGEGSYCPHHARKAVQADKPSERDLVRSVRRYAS